MNLGKLGQIKISQTQISDLPAKIKRNLALLAIGVGILFFCLIYWGIINFSFCSFPIILLILGTLGSGVWDAFDRLRSTIMKSEKAQAQAKELQTIVQAPFRARWTKILKKNSALYRKLPENFKPKLHQLINLFLHKIDFAPLKEEEPSIEITETRRVLVAAEACILILNLRDDPIECINLYQIVKKVRIARNLIDSNLVGQWNHRDTVILVWDYTLEGSKTAEDKFNNIIHEFAHALDSAADDSCDGNPFELKEQKRRGQYVEIQLSDGQTFKTKNIESRSQWQEIIERMHKDLEKVYEQRRKNVIREYGSTNPEEFFAVATEAYLDIPKKLQKAAPDVYRLINNFYELDPHDWAEEIIPPIISSPSPDTFPEILHQEVALYRILPPEEKRELITLVTQFLEEYTFEGRDGLVVTNSMKIAFAGQACILKLGDKNRTFTGFKRIILHPDQFMMNGDKYHTYDATDEIHFSWKSVSEAINQLRKTWQPLLLRLSNNLSKDHWWSATESRFDICLNEYRGRRDNKTLYWWEWDGVKNVYHLFRTSTDDFFCRPYCMHQNLPDLYKAYKDFYCTDPLYWIEERHRELAAKPFPDEWQKCLRRNVKHYTRLPSDLHSKLHGLIHIFLDEISFEKKGVQRITDKMRLCVAAEACILIVNRNFHDYRRMDLVEIWKDKPEGKDDWGGDANRRRVRLNWHWTKDGMGDEDDNYNITMHEFAHVLDNVDDDIAQSVPEPKNSPHRKMWEELLEREYPLLEEAYKSGRGHVIREYGLHTYGDEKRRAEFFPCATEAFFEQSTRLRNECPTIYAALRSFYQLDPANWELPT